MHLHLELKNDVKTSWNLFCTVLLRSYINNGATVYQNAGLELCRYTISSVLSRWVFGVHGSL